MFDVLESLNIKYINTDKRLVKVKAANNQLEINNNTSTIKWRYIYFDGTQLLEKDVFELIDLKKKEKQNLKPVF